MSLYDAANPTFKAAGPTFSCKGIRCVGELYTQSVETFILL